MSIGGYGYVIGCATVRRMLRRRDARKICSLLHTLIYNVAMVTDNSYKRLKTRSVSCVIIMYVEFFLVGMQE